MLDFELFLGKIYWKDITAILSKGSSKEIALKRDSALESFHWLKAGKLSKIISIKIKENRLVPCYEDSEPNFLTISSIR